MPEKLCCLARGRTATVTELADPATTGSLRRLGLCEGAVVEALNDGDPKLLRCDGNTLAVRLELLALVEVCPWPANEWQRAAAERRPQVKLSQIDVGQSAVIAAIDADVGVSQRLMALGLLVGVPVKVLRLAPLGDPLTVACQGMEISLRKTEADLLAVDPS